MMSRKTLSIWTIVMIIVFGGVVILYPMIFHPEEHASLSPLRRPLPNSVPLPPPTIPPVQ
jgi:hypothetical protein